MRDEQVLRSLLEIAHGLDDMGKELIRLGRVAQSVVGEISVPLEVWDKVVVKEWEGASK